LEEKVERLIQEKRQEAGHAYAQRAVNLLKPAVEQGKGH
jgi:hypothetical protein